MAMNFRRGERDEPEINLIPFIDVLLVILIFLMLTTTYSRFTELQVKLPVADAQPTRERPQEIVVSVAADGRYAIDRTPLPAQAVDGLVRALRQRAGNHPDTMVVISADAAATHQAVINVMEASRRAGLSQITFATQATGSR